MGPSYDVYFLKGAPKAPEEDIPDISKMDFRIGRVLEVIHNKLTNIYISGTRLVRTWVKTYFGLVRTNFFNQFCTFICISM